MDGVLVDFESGLAQQDEQTLKEVLKRMKKESKKKGNK